MPTLKNKSKLFFFFWEKIWATNIFLAWNFMKYQSHQWVAHNSNFFLSIKSKSPPKVLDTLLLVLPTKSVYKAYFSICWNIWIKWTPSTEQSHCWGTYLFKCATAQTGTRSNRKFTSLWLQEIGLILIQNQQQNQSEQNNKSKNLPTNHQIFG